MGRELLGCSARICLSYLDLTAVVDVLSLLLLGFGQGVDVETEGMGARHHAVEQFELEGLVGWRLVQQLLQQCVCLLWGQEIVNDGAGSVLLDVFWTEQVKCFAFLHQRFLCRSTTV